MTRREQIIEILTKEEKSAQQLEMFLWEFLELEDAQAL